MNEYKDRLYSVLNDVERIIEDEHDMVKLFLGELFNLLFWKDYREGYVDIDTRHELIARTKLTIIKMDATVSLITIKSKSRLSIYI